MEKHESEKCRICNSATRLKWPSNLEQELTSDSFAITDAHYGQTSAIYECDQCGFRQCTDMPEVLSYYEQLEDPAYEQSRKERYLQAESLISCVKKHRAVGKLLDVGAGSGIFVEAAKNAGYDATGIEPSSWLQQQATKKDLPVALGVLDDISADETYDVITLNDVVEHVADPVHLLGEIRFRLRKNGVAMVITPDCHSFFANMLRRKWWHYRVAHIGYFSNNNLTYACERAGLKVIEWRRPGWYFTMNYLWIRLLRYFPAWMRFGPYDWMKRITLPINLRDSLLVILKPAKESKHGGCERTF